MDMESDHVAESDADDATWQADADLKPNPEGCGDGGVVYGVLLNSRGGAIMCFGNAPSTSTNAVVRNVSIHDSAIAPLEKLKFKTNPLAGASRGPTCLTS